MAKQKIKAKKLKQPLWQELVYLALVGVAPIVITCIELFQSHSTLFKWSFASIGAILIAYVVIRKFIINEKIKKAKAEILQIEHDYSLNIGDEALAKQKWKHLNLVIYIYNAIMVLLAMALIYLFITALADGLIAFRGAALFILLFVLAGMIFKAFTYLGAEFEEVEEDDSNAENN
jgi:hypothetical protein